MRNARLVALLVLGSLSLAARGAWGAPEPRIRISPEHLERLREARGDLSRLRLLLPAETPPPLAPLALPLVLEQNVGQADSRFGFVVRSAGFAAGFSREGVTARLAAPQPDSQDDVATVRGHAIQLLFRGGRPADLAGQNPLEAEVKLVRGSDPSHWHPDVPAFTAVAYRGVYPGIEVIVAGTGGRLRYGMQLDRGASLARVRVAVRGVARLSLDRAGNLLMDTGSGTIVQTRPRFTQQVGDKRRTLEGRFKIFGRTEYGFEVDGWSAGQLMVDPEVVFASYFGGSGNEGTLGTDRGGLDFHGHGFDLAFGPDNTVFVVGTTVSTDFPSTAAGPQPGGSDAFAMKIDPARAPGQQLVYATLVGGSGFERGVAVAARDDGSAYVTGCTTSSDFPTSADAVQPVRGASVGYVVRLTPDGAFDRGTILGSAVVHHPSSIAFSQRTGESSGFVFVAGSVVEPRAGTPAEALPGAFQAEHRGGGFDGFIAKLDPELTAFEYLTYLGGGGRDVIRDLGVNDGFAFVTGSTTSLDFPVSELAMQPAHSQAATGVDCSNFTAARQCFDAFVARLGRTGETLVYSTFFGGEAEEFGRGIAVTVAPQNQATFTGAVKPVAGSDSEIFVARLEAGGENLLFDERLPATGRDHGEELVVDAFGRAHVVGTISRDGLATDATSFHGGASDIFYSRHAAATGDKEFLTYLGGTGVDRGFAVAAAGETIESFCAVVAGSTTSQDVATVNPLEGGEANQGRADLLLVTLCDIEATIEPGSGFVKAASANVVVAGGEVRYTVTVTNGGDVPAPVTITDAVPAPLAVTGVLGPGCSRLGNTVTCDLVAEPGATAIVITADSGEACPRTVRNSATIQVGSREFTSNEVVTQIACPPPLCPNGSIDPGEECDDGNQGSGDGCRANCTREECGDGIEDPGEECDDGDDDDDDACSNSCEDVPGDGDLCNENDPPCQGALVCGKSCSVSECEGGIMTPWGCAFGDSVVLCSSRYRCIDADDAWYTIGN